MPHSCIVRILEEYTKNETKQRLKDLFLCDFAHFYLTIIRKVGKNNANLFLQKDIYIKTKVSKNSYFISRCVFTDPQPYINNIVVQKET